MNLFDELTQRFKAAAANPPRLTETRVKARSGPILPPTDSMGRKRPVLRVSSAQQQAQTGQITERAVEDARRALMAQARKQLTK